MIEVIPFYFEVANPYGKVPNEGRYLNKDFPWGMVPPTLLGSERYTSTKKNGMAFKQEDVLKSD